MKLSFSNEIIGFYTHNFRLYVTVRGCATGTRLP